MERRLSVGAMTTSQFPAWRIFAAGAVTGLLFAILLGFAGLIAGIHWAEARGVWNYARERGAWGLFYFAMPASTAGGIGGYLLGKGRRADRLVPGPEVRVPKSARLNKDVESTALPSSTSGITSIPGTRRPGAWAREDHGA
jgi:hypothetical protein